MKKQVTIFYFIVFFSIMIFGHNMTEIAKGEGVTNADTSPPVITPSANLTYVQGSSGNNISWFLEDENPGNYELYRDETQLSGSPAWSNGQNLTINVDFLPVGIYNYTLVAIDAYANRASSTIWVTVIEPEETSFFWISSLFLLVLPFISKRRKK